MIIEDEVLIAKSLEMDLIDKGFNITGVAADYDEALALVKNEKPDLALVDINLKSEKDGIDVAKWINDHDDNIKILFMTGYGFDVLMEKLKQVTYHKIIEKPVETDDLEPILKSFL